MVKKWLARVQVPLFPLLVLLVIWYFSPGVPVLMGPRAGEQTRQAGHALFVHQWAPNDPKAHGDGLGPVFNANSCVACHSQGGVGGGGDNSHNVLAFEIHPNIRDKKPQAGLVHAFAVDDAFRETSEVLSECFPIIPGGERIIGGCQVRIADFNPIRTQRVNSTALFGAGWIDRISGKAIKHHRTKRLLSAVGREVSGDFETIPAGRPRILPDGRVGKFGWKAQFATLEEFVAAACANELGLGNPLMEQARPLGSDYTCDEADLTKKEFRQLVAFVDTLPRPVQALPRDARDLAEVRRGEEVFSSIGCAACHTPEVDGVKGVYSDFLLHRLTPPDDDGYRHEVIVEVPLPSSHPQPDEWKTPPLWGVADSAPYFHDGGSPTLGSAIARHQGAARIVTEAFGKLPADDQLALIAFLKSLKAPADAPPVEALPEGTSVAMNR